MRTGEKEGFGDQVLQEVALSPTRGKQGSWIEMEQQHVEFGKVIDPVSGDAHTGRDLTQPARSSHSLCQQKGCGNINQGWKDAPALPARMA